MFHVTLSSDINNNIDSKNTFKKKKNFFFEINIHYITKLMNTRNVCVLF